jgi:hypothetical protein
MAIGSKVRVFDLARELKQNTRLIIEELRREGADVDVPSNSVNKEIADKIRNTFASSVKHKTCPLCLDNKILEKNYERHINLRCPRRSGNERYSANQDTGVRSCYHCGFKSKVEDLKLHYPECTKRPNAKKNELSNDNNERSQFHKLDFHILPPGQWSSFDDVLKHFRRLSQTSKWEKKRIDEDRLQKIKERLDPDDYFVGNDEFEGYVVCCFDWTEKVILECPIYGNAIYVIKKGEYPWQEIAKATKREARTKYSDQVKVIKHTDSWLKRLEFNLRINF